MYIDKNDFTFWSDIELEDVNSVATTLKSYGVPFIIDSEPVNSSSLLEPQLVSFKVLKSADTAKITNLVSKNLT